MASDQAYQCSLEPQNHVFCVYMNSKYIFASFSRHHLYMLFLMCLPSSLFSQNVHDDFEGNGTITSWYGDDCTMNTQSANPFKQGINTSATVLEYGDIGGQYANVRFDVSNNYDLSDNHLFTLKIYVPSSGLTGSAPNQISLKLQDGTLPQPWSTQCEIIKPIALNQWQTVTFNFASDPYINLDNSSSPPTSRTDFNRIVLQVNGENNNAHVLAYLDDIHYDGIIAIDPVYDHLVWADEFDADGPVDGSKWFHQTQFPIPGSWYNQEVQHYTNRIANSYLNNGFLNIVARKESFTDQGVTKQYTSARLNSKYAFTYGKVEIRAQLPTGAGTWPAMWTLGKNVNENGAYWDNEGFGTTGWPGCGEIDIMEHWGYNQNYVQTAIHTPSSYGGTVNLGGQTIPTASTDFHVYTMVWTPDKMVFSVDGVIHYTYNPPVKDASTWPFDSEQYILLNIAIQQSIDPGFTQSPLIIDYVRIYQESMVSTDHIESSADQHYYPNPVVDELNITIENNTDEIVSVKIYNLHGQLIKTYDKQISNQTLSLNNLSSLSSGVYILNYTMDNKKYSLRFVKQ